MSDPYRTPASGSALRRAKWVVHGQLAGAMAVVFVVGYRLGLFFEQVSGFEASEDLVFRAVMAGAFAGGWIGMAIRLHPDRPAVARWLVGCGLALHLGAALGSWPMGDVADCPKVPAQVTSTQAPTDTSRQT